MEWMLQHNEQKKISLKLPDRILADRPFFIVDEQSAKKWLCRWSQKLKCFFIIEKKGGLTIERPLPLRSSNIIENTEEGTLQIKGELTLSQTLTIDYTLDPCAFAQKFRSESKKKQGATIKSPMTGVVLSTFVQKGDQISAGQTLVVIEAMKMENKINATTSGILSEFSIQSGDKILTGQILAVIK